VPVRLDYRRRDVYGVRQVCDSPNASACDTNIGATLWVAIAANNGAPQNIVSNFMGILRYWSQGKGMPLEPRLLQLFPVSSGMVGEPVR